MMLRTLLTGPLAILTATLAALGAGAAPTTLDLADIVGGGDGSGSGAAAGVDLTDGSTTTTQTGPVNAPTNSFVAADNPLIDGVVIPDGGAGGSASVPISSTGLSVTGISDSTDVGSHTWDHVWNGANFNTTTSHAGTLLGLHANKGVTFDLEAIGAAYGGLVPTSFQASAITGTSPSAQADFYAFVDGILVASASLSGADAIDVGFASSIPSDARFLTFLVSSDGSSNGDWTALLNPTLDLVPPLTLGQVDTFDSGFDGWLRGHRVVTSGDGCLQIPGPEGVYLITFSNGEQWAGDYTAEGVGRLRMDLRNQGPDALDVRLAFGTDLSPTQGGEWLATATPVSVPPSGAWGTYEIPIGPGDLVAVQGAASYASVMSNVETLRILHNPAVAPRGALTDSLLCIDDVTALPEPAGLPALGAGILLVGTLSRRRRRPQPSGRDA